MNFKEPIVFFDLETTGLNVVKDRIVSIAMIKIHPDGTKETRSKLINPQMKIPKEVSEIHGITDKMVKDSPTFSQLSKGIREFIGDCAVAGFNNNHFDNALLSEEFGRCGIEWFNVRSIDVGNLFKKFETRTLVSALKFYCDKELEGAHDSHNDTVATLEVFEAQMEHYEELKDKDIDWLNDFCKFDSRVDFAGKVAIDEDGDYIFNFGEKKGEKIKDHAGFGNWMLGKDFPENTKMYVRKALQATQEVDGKMDFPT